MVVLMTLIVMLITSLGLAGRAQDRDLKRLFEAGKYEDVVTAVEAQPTPAQTYLAAQAYQRLDRPADARARYAALASRSGDDGWADVGASAVAFLDGNAEEALAAATRARTVAPALPEAHYQVGFAQGQRQDFAAAAAAFEQVTTLDPSFAYAYYHAGLSHYRVKRIDRMAQNFETFLRLAPEAPERGQVESIMRTLRGR